MAGTKNVKKAKKVVKTPPKVVEETPVVETSVVETSVVETPVVDTSVVDTSVVDTSVVSYLDEFSAVVSELDSALSLVRSLKSRVQKLEKLVQKEHKALNKKARGRGPRKVRDPNAPKSGFAKEGPVSDEMRKFLGLKSDELISRTNVTKRIHEYCKDHNLQNPSDKRQINADSTLKKLLKMKKGDDLTFFNLQKYMKVHFPNKDGVYPTV